MDFRPKRNAQIARSAGDLGGGESVCWAEGCATSVKRVDLQQRDYRRTESKAVRSERDTDIDLEGAIVLDKQLPYGRVDIRRGLLVSLPGDSI